MNWTELHQGPADLTFFLFCGEKGGEGGFEGFSLKPGVSDDCWEPPA